MTSKTVSMNCREVAYDLSYNVDSCLVSHSPHAELLVGL
jgi:hypothetical protein